MRSYSVHVSYETHPVWNFLTRENEKPSTVVPRDNESLGSEFFIRYIVVFCIGVSYGRREIGAFEIVRYTVESPYNVLPGRSEKYVVTIVRCKTDREFSIYVKSGAGKKYVITVDTL